MSLVRHRKPRFLDSEAISGVRGLANQAFSRAAGAPLVPGNQVLLLRNAEQNYPAWLAAIRGAQRTIHFENYIVRDDDEGWTFAEAFAARARAGVKVRLIYDWLGGLGKTSRRFWRWLSAAGVEVRCFNPPAFDSPFGWLSRDHRKMLGVDGRVAFVTGLCVGREWTGDPRKGTEPWRDTGIELRGPAVADVERAFAQMWALAGEPLPAGTVPVSEELEEQGEVALRVVATSPNLAGLYRLDLLIAALARQRLWLTDAYFAGVPTYVQALRAAALDGVDVRLLVPGSTDIPLVRPLSQLGFRPLLEAGVRVFAWNGSMMHAKTAVADERWARVGSTNLNVSSWMGNWELDVVVENGGFNQEAAAMYLDDLTHTTEIVLDARRAARPRIHARRGGRGRATRAAAGAVRLGHIVGAALANRRVLASTEWRLMLIAGLSLVGIATIAIVWPRAVAFPLAVLATWIGIALVVNGYRLWRRRSAAP